MRALAALLFASLILVGCSRHSPPQGRWEGTYDTADAMVVARVEIDSKGLVRVTAPNAEDVGDKEADRSAMRQTLAAGLASDWDSVEPREMDFDGKVFRKPGGIAPQMVWDPAKQTMRIVVYLGKRNALGFPLRSVKDFSDNPWPE